MKKLKVMNNGELEKVIGGSLYEMKNSVPRLLGPDGMEGSYGGWYSRYSIVSSFPRIRKIGIAFS